MADDTYLEVTGRCLSCMACERQIAEVAERAPLLGNYVFEMRSRYEMCWLVGLGVIMITGVAAGTYLLLIQDKVTVTEHFTLVTRKMWRAKPAFLNASKLTLPATNVLISQTNTNGCWNETQCIKEIKNLQKLHMGDFATPDIMYNFLVAGDGRIYEGRGWDFQCSNLNSRTDFLHIAFLGNFDEVSPADKQMDGLKAFLSYAIVHNKLSPCFQTSVDHSSRKHLLDAAFAAEKYIRQQNKC